MNMKKSKVLEKLRNGELVSCFKVNLVDARVVEIVSMLGFDCVWTDMEHIGNDFSAIEKQILAAKAYDADIMVRVSRGGYSDYIRPLEMDSTGIMVPHIMSLEDAKKVVRMTRFHPVGRRPLDGGNADGRYCNVGLSDYLKQSNEQRFLAVQIEDPEPMNEIEEIAALDGIDMLFFGPGDFSHSIGAPGQLDHPELLKARETVAKAALKHGKFAGTVASLQNMDELIQIGYSFISIGADVLGLNQYCTEIVSHFSGKVLPGLKSIYGGK